jgi:hypothetical protein
VIPRHTLRLSWPAILGLLGCSAGPSAPTAPLVRPLASASATLPSPPPPAASIAPPAPWRSRRGECDLNQAIDDLVGAEEAERCGDMPKTPQKEEYERARACVLKAQAAHKPFRLMWRQPSIDSAMRAAVAGRSVDGRYEVWWFSYDSCPSGCGDADPMWGSARCGSLMDVRAACKAQAKSKGPADKDLAWMCDEDNAHAARRSIELRCKNPVEMRFCGPEE